MKSMGREVFTVPRPGPPEPDDRRVLAAPILNYSANDRTMYELTITPQGHLLVRETSLEPQDRGPSRALLAAYAESPARGMLYSASEEMEAALPPSFDFARSI